MTQITWTAISTTQPGWSLEEGTLSQDVNSLSITQGVSNALYPEILVAYSEEGRHFLGYCEVYMRNPSGDCTVTSHINGTGMDYTFSIAYPGIDFVELGAYGATGYPHTNVAEPSGLVLALAALITVAVWQFARARCRWSLLSKD